MANDRIHIRCKGCEAWKMLASYNGYTLMASPPILEWINAHGRCKEDRMGDLEGDPCFTLHTDAEVGEALKIDRQNAGPLD